MDNFIVEDSFKSISAHTQGLYKDKGSKFIALAYPVETEDEVKAIIDSVKKQYYDARHHCFAYRLGYKKEVYRASDDGEPSGSSGRPILGQIDSFGLSDVLVVVVRYFGGIKLGVPGLIKAYKTATYDALQQAQFIDKIVYKKFKLIFAYEQMNTIMKILKDMNLPQNSQDFALTCSLITHVRLRDVDSFINKFDYSIDCKVEEI